MKKTLMLIMSTVFNMSVTIAFILFLTFILSLFVSCSGTSHARSYDPVKSPDTYVRKGHGTCGWAYN